MRASAIVPAWGRILRGYRPFLSIEVTKECPLRCSGCYAYDAGHLSNGHGLQSLAELRGDDLVQGIIRLVRKSRPLHVSLVGGEPLIRHRELTPIIRVLRKMGIEVQIVTSAVLPIPEEWAGFSNLHVVVSIDGLRADHDLRRGPAIYDRILRNIEGHQVIVHCTILPQFLRNPDYLREFTETWSARNSARKIWFSLFTPQKGGSTPERLSKEERLSAIDRIDMLRANYPKLDAPGIMLEGMRHPPGSPVECIFAQITQCISSDLSTPVVPCQIGGQPECSECGCIAAAAFACIGRLRLGGILKISNILSLSQKIGAQFPNFRRSGA